MFVQMLNLLHIPSTSTISLEAYFKAFIHRGLNPDQKLSEIIKVSAGSLGTSEDALHGVTHQSILTLMVY